MPSFWGRRLSLCPGCAFQCICVGGCGGGWGAMSWRNLKQMLDSRKGKWFWSLGQLLGQWAGCGWDLRVSTMSGALLWGPDNHVWRAQNTTWPWQIGGGMAAGVPGPFGGCGTQGGSFGSTGAGGDICGRRFGVFTPGAALGTWWLHGFGYHHRRHCSQGRGFLCEHTGVSISPWTRLRLVSGAESLAIAGRAGASERSPLPMWPHCAQLISITGPFP